MPELKNILLAEDNANDIELTLAALRANRLANEVVIARWLDARHPLCVRLIRDQLREHYDPRVCPVTGHRCT